MPAAGVSMDTVNGVKPTEADPVGVAVLVLATLTCACGATVPLNHHWRIGDLYVDLEYDCPRCRRRVQLTARHTPRPERMRALDGEGVR